MKFRQLADIGLEGVDALLLARMHEARNRGSDMRASARPATGFVATDAGEGETPVAFAQYGGVTVAQTLNGKNGRAVKPGRVNREVVRQRSEAQWAAISASLFTANRNKRVAAPTRFAPALATRLFLCVDNGHQSQPAA